MLVWSILIPIVVGDTCQDFCVQQLGATACPVASYCDMDNTCHGLFWSDDSMTDILRDATEYPVVCSEATSGLGSATAIVVQLQFPTLLSEARGHPHVKLFVVNEGRIYDAVFDTGSDISYALLETTVSSGYRLDPRSPRVGAPITLWYGFSGQVREFESMGTIDETIRLCSSDDSNDFFFQRTSSPHDFSSW